MNRRLSGIFLASILFFIGSTRLFAIEGMWIPALLKSLNEDEMKTMGLRLSAEDLYDINNSSIKDAIFQLSMGCTAEAISDNGLLLTNHHCGFRYIVSHSTVEKNYLEDGFWASNLSEELPNKGLKATRIVKIENVTDYVKKHLQYEGTTMDMVEEKLVKNAVAGTHYDAVIKEFYYGNEFYLIVTETFTDVRMVGAPPSSIGVYGGDTDNWMWPRHNADFSMFRIYAGKDNKPADYSKDNVPYKPQKHLTISLKGVKQGDFTMVYGFPGRTQEYLPSYAVDVIVNDLNPMRIKMRTASLNVLHDVLKESDTLRIMYASKAAGIANAWKKWQGEMNGLKRLDAIAVKQAFETEFMNRAGTRSEYANVLDEFQIIYKLYKPAVMVYSLYSELLRNGPECIRLASNMREPYGKYLLLDSQDKSTQDDFKSQINAALDKFEGSLDAFFEDYAAKVDKRLMKAVYPVFFAEINEKDISPALKGEWDQAGGIDKMVSTVFGNTIFTDKEKIKQWITTTKGNLKKGMKELEKDKVFLLSNDIYTYQQGDTYTNFVNLYWQVQDKMKIYMKGIMEFMGDQKKLYPDANSTLRITYGKVEGYSPYDGAEYKWYTTIDGVIEKYKPGDYEFDLLPRFLELYKEKDFGQYGENGELHVCFTASNHTTGGNSGSPVLNADGQLIGLNFDRAWESTMSDIMYDPEKCRNISVDIRYVLWVIDKYAEATHLIDEMTIVK